MPVRWLLLALAAPGLAGISDQAIRKASPPAAIKAELEAAHGIVGPDSSCALVDWMMSAEAPPDAAEMARALSTACRLPVDDVDAAAATAALGDKAVTLKVSGQTATLIARGDGKRPDLCCSLQGEMTRIGASPLWVARYRLANVDQAMLEIAPPQMKGPEDFLHFRGSGAPPLPPRKAGKLAGRIVEDRLHSQALGETRKLFVYIPKGKRPPGGWPALFMADGGVVYRDAPIVEALIEQGRIAPIALIGTESGQEGIVENRSKLGIADLRSADYLDSYHGAGQRFARHMRFLALELPAYARRKYRISDDPAHVAITGFSNGGNLAFQAAILHPGVFGTAIPMSSGWHPLERRALKGPRRARFIVSAGLYETAFIQSTSKSVEALKAAGYNVDFTRYAAGHASDQWETALVHALPMVFGPKLAPS